MPVLAAGPNPGARVGRKSKALVVRGRDLSNDAVDGLDVDGIAMTAGAFCKDLAGCMGVVENERPAASAALD